MRKKTRKTKLLLAIAIAVLVPLSFFLAAKLLKKDHLNMPRYYISEKINGRMVDGKMQYDTIFHRIADLRLTNQMGDMISLNNDLKGKILVIDFIYTSCPSVCPRLTANMKMLQQAFRKDPKKESSLSNDVQLVSITVDPKRDSFQQMRRYADRFGVNHDDWYFLTGDKKDIYDFARNELGVSVQPGDGSEEDFIHTQKIVVVDQNRYIRGYYDGLDSIAIGQCAYDISLLSIEKKKRK